VTEREVRVYVNGRGVNVAASATALDAVRAHDAAEAERVAAGDRAIADSRGLVTPPATPVWGGAIFRVVRARASGAAADALPSSDRTP
jgi:hypothetical protein